MKSRSVYSLLLCVSLICVGVPASYAQSYTSGDWSYVLNASNEATIVGYSGQGGDVTIPSILDGNPVRQIGNGEPTYSWWNNTFLTSVTIPDGVATIGDLAFQFCHGLTNVSLPISVTSIGYCAFQGCENLASIILPDGLITIGAWSFTGCSSLTNLVVPDSVTSIGDVAFANCTGLTNATVGNGVTTIGDAAFGNCNSLTNLFFLGNAPSSGNVFEGNNTTTVYRQPSATGWGATFAGRPTALWVADSDGDGANDFREAEDGTNPNDATSFNVLSKNLVAYYPFDGDANDTSGYGNNGVTTSVAFAPDRFGVVSSAVSFAVDPSYLTTGVGVLPLASQARTLSFWARPNSLPTSLMPAMVSYGSTTSGGNAFGIGIGAGANPYFWGHGVDIDIVGSSTVNQGQWVHLVASLDNSGTLSLFQDGQLVARKLGSGLNTVSAGLHVGRWLLENVEGFSCQFNGSIDQLRVYGRAFSESEVAELFYSEAFTSAGRTFLSSNPSLMGHYSQAAYDANRTNGQADVTTNPSAFNLFTQAQFDGNRTAGRQDVVNNPMSYGLYTTNSIMDLAIGALMIQKQGTNATVVFQPQSTTDLGTLPFTNNGVPITNTIPMPGNKGFLRVRGVGGSSPGGVDIGGGAGKD